MVHSPDMAESQLKPLVGEVFQQAEEVFGKLAEEIGAAFWAVSTDRSQNFYVSPAFESIWEMSRAELRARPMAWIDRVHPDDLERVQARFGALAQTGAADEVF